MAQSWRPGKLIGEKFQSKMGKSASKVTISIDTHRKIPRNRWILLQNAQSISRKKNDLQKIENKFLENLVKSGPARSWRPGNKIMAPGEIQNAQSISRKKMICKKLKSKISLPSPGEKMIGGKFQSKMGKSACGTPAGI